MKQRDSFASVLF